MGGLCPCCCKKDINSDEKSDKPGGKRLQNPLIAYSMAIQEPFNEQMDSMCRSMRYFLNTELQRTETILSHNYIDLVPVMSREGAALNKSGQPKYKQASEIAQDEIEIQVLSVGIQSRVYKIFSIQKKKFFVVKKFGHKYKDAYNWQRYINDHIAQLLSEEQDRLLIPVKHFNDKTLSLYFPLCLTSLDEFLHQSRSQKHFVFKNEYLAFGLLHNLVMQVLALHKINIYHSDIKPENIVVDYNIYRDRLLFRLIDFGSATKNWQSVRECTSKYFCTKERTLEKLRQGLYQFKSPEDRLKAELYSVHFIMIEVLIISTTEKIEEIQALTDLYPADPEAIFQRLSAYYSKELIAALKNMASENYSVSDLEVFLTLRHMYKSRERKNTHIIDGRQINFSGTITKKIQYTTSSDINIETKSRENQSTKNIELNKKANQPTKQQYCVFKQNQSKVKSGEESFIIIKELGKGTEGVVRRIFDKDTKAEYALKSFYTDSFEKYQSSTYSYKNEQDCNDALLKLIQQEPQMEKYLNLKIKFDKEKLYIYYPCGACSLWQLITERMKRREHWFDRLDQLYQLLYDLFTIVLLMHKNGIYHSDIKSQNIVVHYDMFTNKLEFRLIDFGSMTSNFAEIKGYTEQYFANFPIGRTYQLLKADDFCFQDPVLRVRAELNCVCVILLETMYSSCTTQVDDIHKLRANFVEGLGRKYIYEHLASQYPQELVEILKTMAQENYDIETLHVQIETQCRDLLKQK